MGILPNWAAGEKNGNKRRKKKKKRVVVLVNKKKRNEGVWDHLRVFLTVSSLSRSLGDLETKRKRGRPSEIGIILCSLARYLSVCNTNPIRSLISTTRKMRALLPDINFCVAWIFGTPQNQHTEHGTVFVSLFSLRPSRDNKVLGDRIVCLWEIEKTKKEGEKEEENRKETGIEMSFEKEE